MKKIVLLAGFFFLLFSSCEKNEDNDLQKPLLPLDVDNIWTYIDSTFGLFVHNIRTDTIELQYGYYAERNGFSGYSRLPFEENKPASMLNDDDDGNLIQCFISDSLNFKSVFLKKNAKKDETWKFKDVTFTGNGFNDIEIIETEVKCLVEDTVIKTPIGDFSCKGYAYTPDMGRGLLNLYYSENIGLVLYLYENNDIYKKRILIKYFIK